MPYVQSGSAILYSLHRGARSRGLQAGRERELVLGLYVERCGLLEMLISGGGEACVLQSAGRVFVYLVRSALETALIPPFYS